MKDILHIAQDEKFINAAYTLYEESFPEKNHFLIVKPPADPPTRYLKPDLDVEFIVKGDSTVNELLHISKQYKIVVFHGLNPLKGKVFMESEEKEKFLVNIYGAEVYNSNVAGTDYLGDKTRNLKNKLDKKSSFEKFKDILRKVKYRKVENYDDLDLKEALYKIRFFGSLPGYSYQQHIKDQVYHPSLKRIPFSYYPLEFIIKDDDLRADGNNILFGNSAAYTNNHIEAIDLLTDKLLPETTIYCPLSYGYQKYAKHVAGYGKNKLHDKFEPLLEFLPLEEYNNILRKCGFVVMNHYRSQAMGNLIASLYLGAKVFLNDTDAYRYFTDLGCHVFLIDKDLIESDNPFTRLTENEIEHNRSILRSKFSMENLKTGLVEGFEEHFNYQSHTRETANQ